MTVHGGRLQLPRTVRSRAGWLKADEKTAAVVELVDAGVARLRPADLLRERLDSRYAEILSSQMETPRSLLEAATFEDRFREVSVYKDGRLYLTDAVLRFLEVKTDQDELFVQSVGALVEILSPKARERRLQEFREHVLPLD